VTIFVRGISVLSGSSHWLVAGLFWVAVLRGAWVQQTTDRRLFRLCAGVVVVHVVAMTATLGLRLSHLFPVAFARYLALLLPILYLWAALGWLTPFRTTSASRSPRWLHWTAATLFLVCWLVTSPYATVAASGFWTSFAGSKQLFHRPAASSTIVRGEAFYRRLAQAAPETIVLESPGDEHDSIMRLYEENQWIHRRRVLITDIPGIDSSRLDFENMVRLSPRAMLDSEADFLVVHLALFDEAAERFGSFPRHLQGRAERHEYLSRLLAQTLLGSWGPADFGDGWIAIWDLNRIRSAGVR
jgi:hypothetical protein